MTRKYNVGILDDEQSALNILEKFIRKDNDFIITFSEQEPLKALELAINQNIDLMITDIHMPVTNGIWIAQKLIENDIAVAVTSGVWESAHMCINLQIVGFIHKPLTQKNVDHILLKFKTTQPSPQNSKYFDNKDDLQFLKNHNPLNLIAFNPFEILYVKGAKDYAEIYFSKNSPNTKILYKRTLKGIIESIHNPYLIQVHKSFIVNYKKIIKCDYAKVLLESGVEIPIGSTYRQGFFERLNNRTL